MINTNDIPNNKYCCLAAGRQRERESERESEHEWVRKSGCKFTWPWAPQCVSICACHFCMLQGLKLYVGFWRETLLGCLRGATCYTSSKTIFYNKYYACRFYELILIEWLHGRFVLFKNHVTPQDSLKLTCETDTKYKLNSYKIMMFEI